LQEYKQKVDFALLSLFVLHNDGGRIWTDGQQALPSGYQAWTLVDTFMHGAEFTTPNVKGRRIPSAVCGLGAREIVHGQTLFPATLCIRQHVCFWSWPYICLLTAMQISAQCRMS
jgi:hypothetical protein